MAKAEPTEGKLKAAVFALGGCGEPPASATAIIEGPFEEPLAVPPVVAGSSYPTLVAQETDVALLNGRRTKVYGYHAGLLGPTITANTGDTVRVRLENKRAPPRTPAQAFALYRTT